MPGFLHFLKDVTVDEDTARTFLINNSLLPATMTCDHCKIPMIWATCATTEFTDGYKWKCPNSRTCKSSKSIRHGSILNNKRLTFIQFLELLCFLCPKETYLTHISEWTGLNKNTISDYRNMLDLILIEYLLDQTNTSQVQLGGPGKVVELDESKFGKMKYNRGAVRTGSWILGGIERDSDKCFLVVCPGNLRDEATLIPLIQRFVLPGTTIHTDCWSSYNNLSTLGYTHLTVNHSDTFVDPTTGCHINKCEGMWKHAKREVRGQCNVDHTLARFTYRKLNSANSGRGQFRKMLDAYIRAISGTFIF